ncbi:MAG: rod shape-determining protein RodA [Bacteriovoracaceae bacterium]|nr:rod shape-determining protein RodA [Bacteriovoracaceae bacterium]
MFNDTMDTFKRYDYTFFGGMFAIFAIGVTNLYSATHADRAGLQELYMYQAVWFCIALSVGFALSFISSKTFFRYSYIIFIGNVFLLVLVLLLGKIGMGAQRWLAIGPFRLQPSELMKISTVLALSRWFARSGPDRELTIKELLVPLLIVMVPAVLVIVQPDLGTGMLLILILAVMVFYRKLSWKSIWIIVVIAIMCGGVMYKYGLKEYQRKRIITFIDPHADAKGSGYNAIQSEIAIGSGRLLGKGYMKSSQGALAFLPENHTDFVFSIFNEEHGFIGALFLISLYLILFFRYIWLATSVQHFFESVATIGFMAIIFWHTFINMCMVTGLMPVVGIPLPMMSYGGSSMLTFGIVTGIATSFSNSKNLF